jgi:regulator of sigma E protease
MGNQHDIQINRNGKDTTIKLPSNLEEVLAEKSELPIISPRFNFKIASVVDGTPAAKAGLSKEDLIIAIDSQKVPGFLDFKETIQQKKNKTIVLTVLKANATETVNISLKVESDGTIGFKPKLFGFEEQEKTIQYGFFESAGIGAVKAFSFLAANAKGFGKMFSGEVDPRKSLAGPVGMAQMYGSTWDWINFWGLTAMISLGLAFLNILPIPALDGGHVMFLLWEIITRKKVSEKALYIGQVIGMVILGSLMIFIFWVDITRALGIFQP